MSTVLDGANTFGGLDPMLLQQMGVDPSRLQAAAAWLDQMRASQDAAEPEPPGSRPDAESTASLRAELRMLRRENTLLREQADTLADALGACHCFGADPRCPDCDGDGAPGSFLPGKRNFRSFVVPVIESLRELNRTRSTRRAPLQGAASACPESADDSALHGD